MTTDRMKEIHRLLIDALNSHADEGIAAFFHDNYTVHEGFNNGDGKERIYKVTLDMLGQSIRRGIPGLPDKHQTVKMQLAEGDMAFTYCIAEATHSGPWFGIPPTGKRLTYENLYISRFEGEKIAEHWVFLDAFGMLRQIGALNITPAKKG
ncbi:MAG: ester cyclase [Firmicutes bacterium]|nr:ester cyclase [Bacillota bacterium]